MPWPSHRIMMPTASSVIGDAVDIARNLLCGTARRVPSLAYQRDQIRAIAVTPIEKISTHYYFRFSALDRPGVLSKISGVLGNHGISIQSVQQKGRKTTVILNSQHPFYKTFYKTEEAAFSTNLLLYSLACSQLTYYQEDNYEMIDHINTVMSNNVRSLLS